jgi:hypothetical protein
MKMRLLLAALPLALLSLTVACDNDSAVIDCVSDTDCPADTPTCDPTLEQCVADVPDECTEDVDCQLINPDAPTTVENCDNNDDCADDGTEACVFANEATVCAIIAAGPGDCGDDVDRTVDQVEGGEATVCVSADGSCDAGSCSF